MSVSIFLLFFSAPLRPCVSPPLEFSSAKYGLTCPLPDSWDVVARERDDLVFVAKVPQENPGRPGAVACELAVAPESLDDYRTRIAARPDLGLVLLELQDQDGRPRLVTVREFHPPFGGTWRERTVRRIAHGQLYTFRLNADADDPGFEAASEAFDLMVDSAVFDPPDTGAVRVADAPEDANRWLQDEFKFAIDLPEGWRPSLAPSRLALLFANGPPHGIWSDNLLVIARPLGRFDAERLVEDLPGLLKDEDPGSEVLACSLIDQPGIGEAVETVARTDRGPFSMTVLERRFRGDRFEYEVKFTLESERFEGLAPELRRCLDSFAEVPGEVPAAGGGAAG